MPISQLGIRLANARRQRGLTQQQLAFEIGVTVMVISRLERGILNPSLATVERLAEVLDLPPGWLLSGDPYRVPKSANVKSFQVAQP